MAAWNSDQFQKHLEKSDLSPFYLFFGEEVFLINKALKNLKTKVFQDAEAAIDFNFDVHYGGELDIDALAASIETLPMMSSKRLVILKEASQLKAADLDRLAELVSVPLDSIVFVAVFEKIDQRKKIFKDLFKKMTVVDFSAIADKFLASWIDRLTRSYGCTIQPRAAMALQNLVGNRLIDINNELNKLVSYIGDRKQIELTDIEAVVSKYKLDSIFELTAAISEKNTEKALKIQKYLLDQGESEVGILAMITRQIRLFILAQEAIENRLSGSELAAYIGVPPFFVGQYANQARNWSPEKLKISYANLLKIDRNLKSSAVQNENFLIHNILDLTLPH